MNIKITTLDYHRNGVAGEGFYVAHFHDEDEAKSPEGAPHMMAVVFPPEDIYFEEGRFEGEVDWEEAARAVESFSHPKFHNPKVAVVQVDLLPNTTFAQNSFRGDHFAPGIYRGIGAWEMAKWESDEPVCEGA